MRLEFEASRIQGSASLSRDQCQLRVWQTRAELVFLQYVWFLQWVPLLEPAPLQRQQLVPDMLDMLLPHSSKGNLRGGGQSCT